ncbi:hypothetical protein ACNI3K_00185 [Demequina sp. SO4-13]|uniref:hypothetical protein n=1 Tax=Demequina sp. SO4-13 TaxID=3401027 RepID=UPI003AF92F5C
MKMSVRHRALSGLLAGAALLLAGCAVPGQPAAPGAAAVVEGETLSNERVSTLQAAWEDEAAAPAGRRNVITLEMMREPLLAATDEIGFDYHRTQAEQQAQLVLTTQGIQSEPSDALVDAIESAFLMAAFTLLPEDMSALQAVAEQVEADAVTNSRSGDFSAEAFMQSAQQAVEIATAEANGGSPVWITSYNVVNGLTATDSPWLATE